MTAPDDRSAPAGGAAATARQDPARPAATDYVGRLYEAARAFRAGPGFEREHLRVITQFGDRRIAHALSMERTYLTLGQPDAAAPYAAQVDAWLAGDLDGHPRPRLGAPMDPDP